MEHAALTFSSVRIVSMKQLLPAEAAEFSFPVSEQTPIDGRRAAAAGGRLSPASVSTLFLRGI